MRSLHPEQLGLVNRPAGSRVLMRADAGSDIGMGHASRLHALARELVNQGGQVTVVGYGMPASEGIWDVRQGLFDPADDRQEESDAERAAPLQHADARHALSAVDSPDVVILDSYALGRAWQQQVRAEAPNALLVAIDDIEAREHDADLLVDPNLGEHGPSVWGTGRLLRGTAYTPLSVDYRPRPSPRVKDPSRRSLLVSLGGGRSADLPSLARTLAREPMLRDVELVFVIPDPGDALAVEGAVADRQRVRIHGRLPNLRPVVEQADLVLGAGGTSAWERLRLGVPSVVVALARNQIRVCRELDRFGLGISVEDLTDTGSLVEIVVRALDDDALRDRARAVGPLLVDAMGAGRLALAFLPGGASIALREVDSEDLPALLAIANDPLTRRMSRSEALISPDEHLAWFARLTSEDRRTFFVAEMQGIVIGQVRFDLRSGGWELSYALEPSVRGRGLSSGLLVGGIRRLRSRDPRPIVGVVSDENSTSHKLFRQLGFEHDPEGSRASRLGVEVGRGYSAYLLEAHAPTP